MSSARNGLGRMRPRVVYIQCTRKRKAGHPECWIRGVDVRNQDWRGAKLTSFRPILRVQVAEEEGAAEETDDRKTGRIVCWREKTKNNMWRATNNEIGTHTHARKRQRATEVQVGGSRKSSRRRRMVIVKRDKRERAETAVRNKMTGDARLITNFVCLQKDQDKRARNDLSGTKQKTTVERGKMRSLFKVSLE